MNEVPGPRSGGEGIAPLFFTSRNRYLRRLSRPLDLGARKEPVLKRQVLAQGSPSTETLSVTSYSVFPSSGSLAMMHATLWNLENLDCSPVEGSKV